jgi:hypothetical protein
MIKGLTARKVFKKCPHVKKQLWGGGSFGLMGILKVLLVNMLMNL